MELSDGKAQPAGDGQESSNNETAQADNVKSPVWHSSGKSGGDSSGLPEYSFYCEHYNSFKDDIYGFSPYILRKIWYQDKKFKVTTKTLGDFGKKMVELSGTSVKERTVYYTVSSADGFEEIMGMAMPSRALRLLIHANVCPISSPVDWISPFSIKLFHFSSIL